MSQFPSGKPVPTPADAAVLEAKQRLREAVLRGSADEIEGLSGPYVRRALVDFNRDLEEANPDWSLGDYYVSADDPKFKMTFSGEGEDSRWSPGIQMPVMDLSEGPAPQPRISRREALIKAMQSAGSPPPEMPMHDDEDDTPSPLLPAPGTMDEHQVFAAPKPMDDDGNYVDEDPRVLALKALQSQQVQQGPQAQPPPEEYSPPMVAPQMLPMVEGDALPPGGTKPSPLQGRNRQAALNMMKQQR